MSPGPKGGEMWMSPWNLSAFTVDPLGSTGNTSVWQESVNITASVTKKREWWLDGVVVEESRFHFQTSVLPMGLVSGSHSYYWSNVCVNNPISLWIFLLGGPSCWRVHAESRTYLSPLVASVCITEERTSSRNIGVTYGVCLAMRRSLDSLIEPSSSIFPGSS